MECLHDGGEFHVYSDRVVFKGGGKVVVDPNGRVFVCVRSSRMDWHSSIHTEYIRYQSDIPVLEAAYNLAVDELARNRIKGGVFSTGEKWETLWTRDAAYAVHLGLSVVDPAGCRESLARRVFRGEIVQDTGTGGAWPVSTDRVVWGIAAWETYVMTGDEDWLHWACGVLEKTCLHDQAVIKDVTGLIHGESSFLDWRSQSYPDWMSPADIAESYSLSTMVLHAQVRMVLSRMKQEEGKREGADFWKREAEELWGLVLSMFWLPHEGYFGQFLYGRGYPVLSEKPDSLGNLLCVLFGEESFGGGVDLRGLVGRLPHCSMGIPCFHPQKSMNHPFYHNGASWPFVEAYYGQAASLVGNGVALGKSLACLVRSALLMGTNKENINLETGRDDGLALSSNAQLWSIAGMLGIFYKGLFGMRATGFSLSFAPCVPEGWGGEHRLTGGAYRKASFDITVRGEGCRVACCLVNGVKGKPELGADAEGHFVVEVELSPWSESSGEVCLVPIVYDLKVPRWQEDKTDLAWESVPNAMYYRVFRNGVPITQTEKTSFRETGVSGLAHYQVMACSLDGRESFLNEPREWTTRACLVETRPCGLKGDQAWLTKREESASSMFYDIYIPEPGVYRVEAYYSNATENLRDGNTCALRSLVIDGVRRCSLAFPHGAEQGDWEHFSYSSGCDVVLGEGVHHVELSLMPEDENANYFVNECLIKSLRFVRVNQEFPL